MLNATLSTWSSRTTAKLTSTLRVSILQFGVGGLLPRWDVGVFECIVAGNSKSISSFSSLVNFILWTGLLLMRSILVQSWAFFSCSIEWLLCCRLYLLCNSSLMTHNVDLAFSSAFSEKWTYNTLRYYRYLLALSSYLILSKICFKQTKEERDMLKDKAEKFLCSMLLLFRHSTLFVVVSPRTRSDLIY